jgi:hypothetical protein
MLGMRNLVMVGVLKVMDGDALIVIRKGGEVEYVHDGEKMNKATLLAYGLARALENDEWREKLMARAAEQLEADVRGAA